MYTNNNIANVFASLLFLTDCNKLLDGCYFEKKKKSVEVFWKQKTQILENLLLRIETKFAETSIISNLNIIINLQLYYLKKKV